jgi:hypothetical protein
MDKKTQEIVEKLSSRDWRLNSGIYKIIDKQGKLITFKPNQAQKTLLDGLHYLNIIPKARQLGMSTFIAIFILDMMLWNDNISAGIVDKSISDAKKKLHKIRIAYNNLPDAIKKIAPIVETDNQEEIRFKNGSNIVVGTSHRGGTLQVLHVSEFAPIEKESPEKAREIVTGALNAVDAGNFVFIESTATGGEGYFYEYCKKAQGRPLEELTKLDYKLFFFSWYDMPEYSIKPHRTHRIDSTLIPYFESLKTHGIFLTEEQKCWYEKKYEVLGEDIKQEYPSILEEAFFVSDKDKIYMDAITRAYENRRICEFEVENQIEVETHWDIGRGDFTSIIFVQRVGKEVRIIDFFEDCDEHISYYAEVLKRKPYIYGTNYLPHDAKSKLIGQKENVKRQLENAGFKVKITPKLGKELGIQEARKLIPQLWYKRSTTTLLIDHLRKYKKKWNKTLQRYEGQIHDIHSHACDAFRYLAVNNVRLGVGVDKDEYLQYRAVIDRAYNQPLASVL